jgi:hypothetical protein
VKARIFNNGQSALRQSDSSWRKALPTSSSSCSRKNGSVKVGDPFEGTELGPISTPDGGWLIWTAMFVNLAAGAKILTGGKPLDRLETARPRCSEYSG